MFNICYSINAVDWFVIIFSLERFTNGSCG